MPRNRKKRKSVVVSVVNAHFSFKLVTEVPLVTAPFRQGDIVGLWADVRQSLEDRFRFRKMRQQKKSTNHGRLQGWLWDDWHRGMQRRRAHPLHEFDRVLPDDKLVLGRFPEGMALKQQRVSTAYLRFHANESEAQRLRILLDWDVASAMTADEGLDDETPPPSYICRNCWKPGHWRRACPVGKRMQPKGIPKMFLKTSNQIGDSDSGYILEDGTLGEYVVYNPITTDDMYDALFK